MTFKLFEKAFLTAKVSKEIIEKRNAKVGKM